jgi:crotonobetainyl-CoA:carnitine CoA-transferase CaiB-like acyl-CoA transferase
MLDELFLSKPLAAWLEILAQHRLIWAPVLTLAEAVEDPQAEVFGSFPTVEHPTQGRFRTVAPPLQMSGHALDGSAPAPALSADTETVLRGIGVSEEHIALLLGGNAKGGT